MPRRSNRFIAANLIALVAGMLMLAYASVPLYRLFCQVTGYGGTTRESSVAPSGPVSDRIITVEFNADTDPSLPWEFKPGEKRVRVKVGQQATTFFTARNLTNQSVTGRATYNVLPFAAGSYFVKIQCFCFSEQTLAPNASAHMPVLFYIDPSILQDHELDNLKTITLSYTFFSVKTELDKHQGARNASR